MNTMFNNLLQLPLFQGLTLEDLTSILGKVKLHFKKHKPGSVIAKAGESCNGFVFILNGEIASTTDAPDASYTITEHFAAPYLIEPQSLFGMKTVFISTHTALCETDTVSIDKAFILNELYKYEVFRINYTNILSNRAQQLSNRLWRHIVYPNHLIRFIFNHLERPYGRKSFKIKMDVLAQLTNESRSSISKQLNALQEQGLLELKRGEIVIPDAKKLLT